MNAVEAERQIREVLAEGHCFRAHDLCREALASNPGHLNIRLLSALVSLRVGDVSDAKSIVDPLLDEFESTESRVQRLSALLGSDISSATSRAQEVASLLNRLSAPVLHVDASAMDLMAEISRESWRRLRDDKDLRRAATLARRAYALDGTPDRAFMAGLLVALCGAHEEALELVAASMVESEGRDSFVALARRSVYALLRGEKNEALESLRSIQRIGQAGGFHFGLRVALRRDLEEIASSGLDVPDEAFEALPPPSVILFCGPCMDPPGASLRCFTPEMEDFIARKISDELDSLSAEIGYSCADPGANLMFIEAMLERDAEINIILPCAIEDFVENRVRPAGRRWEKRFRSALKLAHSVTMTTTDPLLNDQTALEHNDRIIDGTARLRARSLGCKPFLLAIFDFNLPATPGSTASFIDHWGDPARLRMIDLDDCRSELGIEADFSSLEELDFTSVNDVPSVIETERAVRAMLFADIVGYSKLREEDLPGFWRFMSALADHMQGAVLEPVLIESWGDALYVVHKTSRDMAAYALALTDAFRQFDSRDFGLPNPLSIRIGLHTGPVFNGRHPLTGRAMVYGGQVNRAARIEPIGKPGMIYASEQFVAALVAEESLFEDLRESQSGFAFEYLGTLELAKNYGQQAIYLITRAKEEADQSE